MPRSPAAADRSSSRYPALLMFAAMSLAASRRLPFRPLSLICAVRKSYRLSPCGAAA